METKLDSRQGQFPASFPDTFKDFFAMMSEEEDHIDLFSNLLEDKVIPRANNKFNQRRYGGSLRCTTHPGSASGGAGGCASNAGIGGSGGVGGASSNHNVGRSNSFRVHRPRNSYASLSNSGGGIGSSSSSGSVANGSGSGNLFCKHIKYCCLHQQQQQQQQQQKQKQKQQQQPHKTSNQQLFQQKQQQQQHLSHAQHYCEQNYQPHDYGSNDLAVGARQGPDGEDNNGVGISGGTGGPLQLNDVAVAAATNERQQQPSAHMSTQKRHSIILERAFDFDASCEESDTISTTSSTPTTNIPYSALKPILKQPQPHTQNQHQQQQQQQQQSNTTAMHGVTTAKTVTVAAQNKELPHRTLPQPPKGSGIGAYHTKEAALQRIQQQSGLVAGSKTNLAALSGMMGSTANIAGSCNAAGGVVGGVVGGGGVGASGTTIGNNHYSGSNYNLDGNGGDGGGGGGSNVYIDLHSPTAQLSSVNKFNDLLNPAGIGVGGGMTNLSSTSRSNLSNIRAQKSPILQRRRSSSIVANLLTADITYNRGIGGSNATVGVGGGTGTATAGTGASVTADDINNIRTHAGAANVPGVGATMPHSNTRDRISMAKSPVANKPARMPFEGGGVLTFQQAISGAVSPQYSATSPLMHMVGGMGGVGGGGGIMGVGSIATGLDMMGSSMALASVLEDAAATSDVIGPDALTAGDSPTSNTHPHSYHERFADRAVIGGAGGGIGGTCVGGSSILHSSSATIAQLGNKQRQRLRTSSMPAESRKPRLADTRRAAIHCADIDLEYYRLRSFSITSHGVCNLGDSLRSRRSRSINSVTSTGTSNSGKDRHNSNASRTSGENIFETNDKRDTTTNAKAQIPAYKIAMLGASGVGKTTLTYQFTTSDYICAYDLSLDDDYGQKTVSVLVDGIETDLEIIDHPACEMSAEAFCSTYNIDLFVVVYSVVDRSSFKAAEKVLQYLKENEMLLTRGAILVGNKTDLERHREVTRQMGRKVAKEIACKFIETSSGLDHNVDELLVGIVAQVKLNPQRIRNLSERDRQRLNLQSTIQKHRRMHMPPRRIVRQMSMCQADEDDEDDGGDHERDESHSNNAMLSSNGDEGIGTGSERTASTSLSSSATNKSTLKGPVRKFNKRTLNLESILKMGESELEDEEEAQRQNQYYQHATPRPQSKFELLTVGGSKSAGRTPFGTPNSSPKSRQSNESSSAGYGRSGAGAGAGGGGVGKKSGTPATVAHYHDTPAEENLLDDEICNRKTVSKLTIRTKVFLSSVLKFKKAINVAKRRTSSSCSDLFVI